MENQTKKARRTADQILFAEQEKLEQKKRALRSFEKLLSRFEKISTEIIEARDELEAAGMGRANIIDAFQLDPVATKLLKTTTKKTTPAKTETETVPEANTTTETNPDWQDN